MAIAERLRLLVAFFQRLLALVCPSAEGAAKQRRRGGPPSWLPVAAGYRVLVVGAGARSAALVVEALAAEAAEVVVVDGSQQLLACLDARVRRVLGERPPALRLLRETFSEHAAREYDAVLVDAAVRPSRAPGICGFVRPGGALAVSGASAPSLALSLARRLCALAPAPLAAALEATWPAGDGGEWLAPEMVVERRCGEGWLLEALVARRRPGGVEAAHAAVERLRRLYGSCSMSYCMSPAANRIGSPERDLRYHLHGPPGEELGCIAYVDHVVMGARLRCVIMDPVAAPGTMEALLQDFVRACGLARVRPLFSCVGAGLAEPLLALGFHATKLGAEIALPLRRYTTPKERRRYLRAAASKGLEVFDKCYDMEELDELNDTWLSHKACGHEAAMWTWPPSLPKEGGGAEDEVRRLFTYLDGELVGFVCAEPFYRGDGSGEVLGYGLNTIRFRPNVRPAWASDLTIAALIEALQAEGKAEYLAFGLSPFTELCRRDGDSWFLSGFFELLWDANFHSFYNFLGLAKKKAHHCSGQGERLEERLMCGPRDTAISDYVRFMSLLVDDMSCRIPAEIAGIMGRTACRLLRHAAAASGHAAALARRACHRAAGGGEIAQKAGPRCRGGARRAQEATPGVGTPPKTEKAEAFITCFFLTTVCMPVFGVALALSIHFSG